MLYGCISRTIIEVLRNKYVNDENIYIFWFCLVMGTIKAYSCTKSNVKRLVNEVLRSSQIKEDEAEDFFNANRSTFQSIYQNILVLSSGQEWVSLWGEKCRLVFKDKKSITQFLLVLDVLRDCLEIKGRRFSFDIVLILLCSTEVTKPPSQQFSPPSCSKNTLYLTRLARKYLSQMK